MYHILIDGDNISIESYLTKICSNIESIVKENPSQTTIVCQSTLVIKYASQRMMNMNVHCCSSKNKNATDATILYLAGKITNQGSQVIIVSNDKIFLEISETFGITLLGYINTNKVNEVRLKKKNIVKVINKIRNEAPSNHDIFVSDLIEYFPSYDLLKIRKYIENLPEIVINSHDVVYIQKN